jgi:hypothetical protein
VDDSLHVGRVERVPDLDCKVEDRVEGEKRASDAMLQGPALEKAIGEFIEAHNSESKPFVWTKTADEILTAMNPAPPACHVHAIC